MVAQSDTTIVAMRTKVRRLTGSPSPTQLSDDIIDQAINTYYNQDLPSSLKVDQIRTVLELFTSPNIDRYSVDLNVYQGITDPVYIEGRQSCLFVDRGIFYARWPQQTTKFLAGTGDGANLIFSFTIAGAPIVRGTVTIGSVTASNAAIQAKDDSLGNIVQSGVTIGTINYLTGLVSITFLGAPGAPAANGSVYAWSELYSPSRPIDVLFWKDEIILRPIPDDVYRVEIEAIESPTEFTLNTDSPILKQWWQLIALGAAIKILQDRQDIEGLENVLPWFEEQKGLALERQANEQIGVANETIYSSNSYGYGDYWRSY